MTPPHITSIAHLYRSSSSALCGSVSQITDAAFTPNQAHNDTICLVREDLTTLNVHAIVNAANKSLMGGGGVDGAIHRAAGPELKQECKTLKGCETGSAKMTKAYGKLACRHVIHAVGPVYQSASSRKQGGHEKLLKGCYRTALELAGDGGLKSIAFSAISTGVYGYPSDEAAEVVLKTVREFLDERSSPDKGLEKIVFCNFTDQDEAAYERFIPKYFPPTKQDLGEAAHDDDAAGEETSEQGTKRQGDAHAEEQPAEKRAKVESADHETEKTTAAPRKDEPDHDADKKSEHKEQGVDEQEKQEKGKGKPVGAKDTTGSSSNAAAAEKAGEQTLNPA